jgi:hypothetical protein
VTLGLPVIQDRHETCQTGIACRMQPPLAVVDSGSSEAVPRPVERFQRRLSLHAAAGTRYAVAMKCAHGWSWVANLRRGGWAPGELRVRDDGDQLVRRRARSERAAEMGGLRWWRRKTFSCIRSEFFSRLKVRLPHA